MSHLDMPLTPEERRRVRSKQARLALLIVSLIVLVLL